jgi:hypothetical protein
VQKAQERSRFGNSTLTAPTQGVPWSFLSILAMGRLAVRKNLSAQRLGKD